ncbi:MAG: DNA-3-methyladenine glycosylase [Candidatus Thorarchaeota archaeon]
MREMNRLSREFFNRETQSVAKDLIGKYLVRKIPDSILIGKIIEVEAYLGPNDKACHTYNYKKTEKTKTMYLKPGTLYVYFIYGMYFCLNVITEPEGIPCAVLIRQLYPIEGIEIMKENRKVRIGKNYKNLLDGPSKLCMAMNITKSQFNGRDSCASNSELFFTEGEKVSQEIIVMGKRIGIEYAEEDQERLLRYTLLENI